MPRIKQITIEGYRSISDPVTIKFPENTPVIMFGENNAGKSNIVDAVNLLFGEHWPGTRNVQDRDFWNRTRNSVIRIEALMGDFGFSGGVHDGSVIDGLRWTCDPNEDNQISFGAICDSADDSPIVFLTNKTRRQFSSVVVNDALNVEYQLSYKSENTLLNNLAKKFHSELIKNTESLTGFKNSLDEVIKNLGNVDNFSKFRSQLLSEISSYMANWTYQFGVDFSIYDPENYFRSISLTPKQGNQVRSFAEISSGHKQILAIAFIQAFAKVFQNQILLIIEEPETHLHPLAQRWLARKLHDISKSGNIQILITTHSPEFVNLEDMEGIVRVYKVDDKTRVRQITKSEFTEYCISNNANPKRTNADTILPFYANGSTIEIITGLFGKSVVIVEGQTEQYGIPSLLEITDCDVRTEGINVVPVMGKGNLAKWWRFFKAFNYPVYVIFDNDNQDDPDCVKRQDILKTLGCSEEDIERLCECQDWLITDSYCVFGTDFEETLRQNFDKYAELERDAHELFGDSKPLVASQAIKMLKQTKDNSNGWRNLSALANNIRKLNQ